MYSKIIESPLPKVDIPEISLTKFILEKTHVHEDKTFLIEHKSGNSYSFKHFENDCLIIANHWAKFGLKKDDKFAIISQNSFECAVSLIGGIFAGGIAVPISRDYLPNELQDILLEYEIKLIAISQEKFETFKETILQKRMPDICFIINSSETSIERFPSYSSLISTGHHCDTNKLPNINPKNDVCIILRSGGTTGPSKGCLITHYNLVSLFTIGPVVYGRTSEDIISAHTPMEFISGINALLLTLTTGSKLILQEKFVLENLFSCIEQYKITAFSAAASVYIKLYKKGTDKDISSLRKLVCGSEPLPNGFGKKLIEKYPFIKDFRQGLGMTEMTILMAMEPIGGTNYDSVGVPTPGNEIVIVDPESGNDLGPNQPGEICVRGPTAFKGYYKNDEATKKTFDSQGFLHTGDIGYYDENKRFYVVDRIKEMIKCDGMQVPPAELQAIFLTHEAVEEAIVIGIPDEISVEIPAAFVVIRENYKNKVTSDELLKYVNERILPTKRIRGGVHFIDKLPKNNFGKVLRSELKKNFKSFILN